LRLIAPLSEEIMGSATMGKVFVRATLENLGDIEMRERGLLPPEQVRRVEVSDALVDTGATAELYDWLLQQKRR
jgi:hypothetical protein